MAGPLDLLVTVGLPSLGVSPPLGQLSWTSQSSSPSVLVFSNKGQDVQFKGLFYILSLPPPKVFVHILSLKKL